MPCFCNRVERRKPEAAKKNILDSLKWVNMPSRTSEETYYYFQVLGDEGCNNTSALENEAEPFTQPPTATKRALR